VETSPVREQRQRLDPIFPNPFSESTSMRFFIERSPASVRIDVFDVSGRRVATLFDAPMTRGTHVVAWDGRDVGGRRVAPGTYFTRLVVNGERVGAKKVTVLH
jgi:flagellar hook assembly protein FlgD